MVIEDRDLSQIGKDIVSFALGFTLPNRTSAKACPAWVPGNQASTIAVTCSASQESANGLPFIKTKTTGFPVLTNR